MAQEIKLKEILSFDELINQLRDNRLMYNIEEIKHAYDFVKLMHKDEVRVSGKPYIHHTLNVAYYVAQLKLDTNAIVAALLHDTISKANISIDDIDKQFGTEVAFIVDGLQNLKTLSKTYTIEHSGEEFTNLIFNASDDLRIIIIRLADKLHNIVTLDNTDKKIQEIAAQKILNIYSPLAEFMGLGFMQRALNDAAFKILEPQMFATVQAQIDNLSRQDKNIIMDFQNTVEALLKRYNIKNFEVSARKKGTYSAYRKIFRKYIRNNNLTAKAFAEIKDIFAIRIIVPSLEDCYKVLGAIHSEFEYSPDHFEDYISVPKENGYKSIHSVITYEAKPIEIQIRTLEMHEYNEFGPACHIAYKLQGSKKNLDDTFTWTKQLVDWKDANNATLSKDDFKIDIFKESVFVFTPKGLVIRMRKGANALDFAYRIHTDIGHRYRGAIINGKMVKMDYELKTGDRIEIITDSKINASMDWLKIAKVTRTKDKIKKALRL